MTRPMVPWTLANDHWPLSNKMTTLMNQSWPLRAWRSKVWPSQPRPGQITVNITIQICWFNSGFGQNFISTWSPGQLLKSHFFMKFESDITWCHLTLPSGTYGTRYDQVALQIIGASSVSAEVGRSLVPEPARTRKARHPPISTLRLPAPTPSGETCFSQEAPQQHQQQLDEEAAMYGNRFLRSRLAPGQTRQQERCQGHEEGCQEFHSRLVGHLTRIR